MYTYSRGVLSLVLVVAGLILCATPASAQLGVTDGYPYFNLVIQKKPDVESIDLLLFRTQMAKWVRENQGGLGFGSLPVPDGCEIHEVTTSNPAKMKVTLIPKYPNGKMYLALEALHKNTQMYYMFGTNYSYVSAEMVENPSSRGAIHFEEYGAEYVGSWTRYFTMTLNFSPQKDKKVVVKLTNPEVSVEPEHITVAWPDNTASFRMRSFAVGVKEFTREILYPETTDTKKRFDFWVFNPTLTVLELAKIEVTPPDPDIINYNMTATNPFSIVVPNSYRDPTLNLIVSVHAYPINVPPAAPGTPAVSHTVTVVPSNVSVTRRGIAHTFVVIASVGEYKINYTILEPFNRYSSNNNYFSQPKMEHNISVVRPLNITIGNIPDAYMMNPVASPDYGGAYSTLINVHLQRPPKVGLTITLVGDDSEFFPKTLSFGPRNKPFAQFRARAHSQGLKTVYFELNGPSAADYIVPPKRYWRVHGHNPNCVTEKTSKSCFELNGCVWNEKRTHCSNTSLPISLGDIPVLFDGEKSIVANFTLPTPVQKGLTVQFIAAKRLVFSPPTITLQPGETSANFSVTGYLLPRDDIVDQPFYLRLSGPDANYFQQIRSSARVRPRIRCNVITPVPFYVGTDSDNFEIVCDDSPEEEVFFTPRPRKGLTFVPVGMTMGLAVHMDSTRRNGFFFAHSTDVVGTFTVTIAISGKNKERYEPIPPVTIRTLPLATLNVLPPFHIAQYGTSAKLHLDVSAKPLKPITVTMEVSTLTYPEEEGGTTPPPQVVDSKVVKISPEEVEFVNTTQRHLITITGFKIGNYTIKYEITGLGVGNYEPPKTTVFEVRDPKDGNVFKSRLELGYEPRTACRVDVGKNSWDFLGQDEPLSHGKECRELPILARENSTGDTLCPAQPTEERCRHTLATTGTICFWFNGSCTYFPAMQGKARDLAYGSGFVVFLTDDHQVWSVGSDKYGQLGHEGEDLAQVPVPGNVSSVVAGSNFVLALTATGGVWSWGANHKGQLGTGSLIQQSTTIYELEFPRLESIACISAGLEHAGATSTSGRLYMWGNNEYGQTGNKETFRKVQRSYVEVSNEYFYGLPVSSFQCRDLSTTIVTEAGAYTFGFANDGALGRAGFDEWMPKKTVLWSGSRYSVPPEYPSFVHGGQCRNN